MAAPTNVNVESNSPTQATVRWIYPGSNLIGVWRAPHGGAFTELTTPTTNRVAVGTLSYADNTAVAGTFYDYKVSDDGGSTFSSVVSVVIQTCSTTNGSNQQGTSISLPQFTTDAQVTADALQELGFKVETALNLLAVQMNACVVCAVNGAVVLDCTSGCSTFIIVANTDINSISTLNCFKDGTFNFVVPPGVSRKVAGFKAGTTLQGFLGGGTSYVIDNTAGTKSKWVTVEHRCNCSPFGWGSYQSVDIGILVDQSLTCICDDDSKGSTDVPNASPTGTGGTSGCTPSSGLTIVGSKKDGSPNTKYSLNCGSDNQLNLQACGGFPPYTWSFTGGINFAGSNIGRASVLPPTNNGSSVAGEAYAKAVWHRCNGGFNQTHRASYGCDDAIISALASTVSNGAFLTAAPACQAFITAADFAIPIVDHSDPSCTPNCDGCPNPTLSNASGGICDMRSAAMITAGCSPCALQSGATVTVTDSIGTSVTIAITA